jgi:ketosteroid isomerase-like protein
MKQFGPSIVVLAFLACCCTAHAGGTANRTGDEQKVDAIFAAHDGMKAGLDPYLRWVAEDVILMPHDGVVIEGKAAYAQHIRDILAAGDMAIHHEPIAVYSFAEMVIVRGRATGSFTPNGQTTSSLFETKNVFIFRRLENGELRVWQIIFNRNPDQRPRG